MAESSFIICAGGAGCWAFVCGDGGLDSLDSTDHKSAMMSRVGVSLSRHRVQNTIVVKHGKWHIRFLLL